MKHKVTFTAELIGKNEYRTTLEHELKGAFTTEELAKMTIHLKEMFKTMILKAIKDSIDQAIDLNQNPN